VVSGARAANVDDLGGLIEEAPLELELRVDLPLEVRGKDEVNGTDLGGGGGGDQDRGSEEERIEVRRF
jgi:hypothetical protein